MNWMNIVFPILVGSVIGYCTNYIAIKMLFHPHKAIYIGKHQLPFTPGIIPKNQKRMANAVGDAVKDQLLTRESLIASLGDGGTIEKLAGDLTNSIYQSDKRVDELFTKEGACEETVDAVSGTISRAVMEKVNQVDLNAAITWQRRERPRLRDIALEKGFLRANDLVRLEHHQLPGEKLWETALRMQVLDRAQLRLLVRYQRLQGQPLGCYFTRRNLLLPSQVDTLLRLQRRHNLLHTPRLAAV